MGETKLAHIVEIPADQEHQQTLIQQHHPLAEISRSPGHFLLLKLWQREEDLRSRGLAMKESRMDSIKQEIFQLCCYFFVFHGLFFTIMFTSSSPDPQLGRGKWWIPCVLSLCSSAVIVFLVQLKLCRYWKMDGRLQRERAEGRALTRCIQELRMKGESFDLCKEPQNGRRVKSSSVEIEWRPLTWCTRYCATVCLVCLTGLVFPACRFILCA